MSRLKRGRKFVIFYVILLTLSVTLVPSQGEKKENKPQPFDVLAKFYPSGWMGDGEKGTQYVQFLDGWKQGFYSAPVCVKVTYSPGPKGWAGIYWQNKPDNWGDKSDKNFKKYGYTQITFRVKGEKGGEIVEFKAGGIDAPGKKFKDSFEASTGRINLEKEWKQYTIDLEDEDLSCVIGGFCWVASKSANPDGVTFYIDDVYYE
ncbi:MAG: hypothetical protein PVH61_13310 [Candidatus Aminicenantes bacterium]|jgi:hypothetical protein